jgi:hypothetical protein
VAARFPHLSYICRIHGFAAKPALELLISNPLDLRIPMPPTLAERGLEPLVSMCNLRGSDFFEP